MFVNQASSLAIQYFTVKCLVRKVLWLRLESESCHQWLSYSPRSRSDEEKALEPVMSKK
jgi:hypothetical protein